LLSRVVEKIGTTRESLADDLSAQLALRANQRTQVSSAIDRLLTQGKLTSRQGGLEVHPSLLGEILSTRALADSDWAKLSEELSSIVNRHIAASQRGKVRGDRLLGSVGAALVSASALAGTDVSGHPRRDTLLPKLRERLQQLAALLAEVGIADPSQRNEVLNELIAEASNTPSGQALIAAELFLVLSGLDTSHLARALGMETMPPIILDASVAIPMFTSLLYRPASSRYFIASHQLYQQARSHRAQLRIPSDYLEEVATHLIDAWRYYLPLLNDVPELQNSTNAYVAHFAYLRDQGRVLDFASYVKGLGVNPGILDKGDFYEIRRIVVQRLEATMLKYGITVTFRRHPPGDALKDAQVEITYSNRKSGQHRPEVTLRHDARVIAHMDEASRKGMHILCSWDRLLLDYHHNTSHIWSALDPSALSDVMALAAGSSPGEDPSLISASTWVRALAEEDADRAATIWDWLARNEKGNMMDAEALASAREFVTQYTASASSTRPHELAESWTAWKNSQSSGGVSSPDDGEIS
jgi:hypothetical protein